MFGHSIRRLDSPLGGAGTMGSPLGGVRGTMGSPLGGVRGPMGSPVPRFLYAQITVHFSEMHGSARIAQLVACSGSSS
jgi:hypothetical protein